MCCDHCHCEIAPGTERTIWDGVKRWVRVCAVCLPFVASITFGQTSPTQEPPPIARYARSISVDSSVGAGGPTEWRREGWSRNRVIIREMNGDSSCSALVPSESSTLPSCPTRLPEEDKHEPEHLPEESGSTISPINFSGIMANVQAQVTTVSWEPRGQGYSPLDDFFMKPVPHTTLKVGSVHAPRPMPRARRSC